MPTTYWTLATSNTNNITNTNNYFVNIEEHGSAVHKPEPKPALLDRWRTRIREGYHKTAPDLKSGMRNTMKINVRGGIRTGRFAGMSVSKYAAHAKMCADEGRVVAQAISPGLRGGDWSKLIEYLTDLNARAVRPFAASALMSKLNRGVLLGRPAFVCGHCGTGIGVSGFGASITTESRAMVAPCCSDNYTYAGFQDAYVLNDSLIEVESLADSETGDTEYVEVSQRWADTHCRHLGFRHVTNELYDYLRRYGNRSARDRRWDGDIGCYHSSVGLLTLLPSAIFDKREIPLRAGIELEIEVDQAHDTQEAAREVIRLMNKTEKFALAESDSSLTHGFEVVTRFGGLDVMTERLAVLASPEFKGVVKKFRLRSHDTTTCGLHVTIDRANMSKLHQGKLRVFANAPQNKHLFLTVCRRYYDKGERYARIKATDFNRVSRSGMSQPEDRYEIFNLTKPKVIEFRGPKGTLKYESVIAAIEFARMCWFFTRDTALSQLDTGTFLEYIVQKHLAPETKFLRQYLIERKILAAPIPESTSASRRLNLREALFDAITAGHIAVPNEV